MSIDSRKQVGDRNCNHTRTDATATMPARRDAHAGGAGLPRAFTRIALGCLVGLLSVLPSRSDADLIRVGNLSGDVDVGSSSMFLRHEVGGELYWDSGDQRWSTYLQQENPPGMVENDNWLGIYSDQISQFGGTDWELRRDNRPFGLERGAEEYNQNFPLVLDTQGPNSISSSNNNIRFELQSSIDEGREFYQWSMTLNPDAGASWVDDLPGDTRSGTWDLAATGGQGGTLALPSYNLVNTQGQYGTLDVLPIPEPSSVVLLLIGAGGVMAWRRKSKPPRA